MRKIIFWSGGIVIGFILALAGLTFYQVLRALGRSPQRDYEAKRAVGYEKLAQFHPTRHLLKTEDGHTIETLVIERADPDYVLLIAHGRWQAKELIADFVNLFDRQTIVLFDFRAHGNSTGNLISFGYCELLDVKAVLGFVRSDSRTSPLPLVGIGLSMGGAALLRTQALLGGFKALVLDSVFARLDIAVARQKRDVGIFAPLQPLARWYFSKLIGTELANVDPLCWIQALDIPVLIIASIHDGLVAIEDAYALYDAASSAQLWVVPNIGHVRIYKELPDKYEKRVEAFLRGLD